MSSTRHPLRSWMVGLLACLPLLLPSGALAQSDDSDAGAEADAGADAGSGIHIPLPDASVGEGGPDRDNPEGEDGQLPTTCRRSGDCAPRFTCQEGMCRYTGVRQAQTAGCLLGPEATLLVVGLAAVAAPRRKKKR
ncbi:hypothetical protein JY651_47340 [Pyxidicoccus parkwayensis]|uniref:Lipoprotein n=1 Tax=Pyxidicoccus parkwayensis TaxID=2813578 RepID=A0ABX7NW46_9BACT|nr:MXAN_6627.5 family MYXO-CTERM protein [Pyxidicoccus parkwaysis]QSQ22641.1 hypothetical protein JY651_47340 [Pyxidicoccus parkwaysis]